MSIVIMPCYILLEVIREYAVEQLQVMWDEDLYQQRYAGYYAEFSEETKRVGPSIWQWTCGSSLGQRAGSDERLISYEQFRQSVYVELHS